MHNCVLMVRCVRSSHASFVSSAGIRWPAPLRSSAASADFHRRNQSFVPFYFIRIPSGLACFHTGRPCARFSLRCAAQRRYDVRCGDLTLNAL